MWESNKKIERMIESEDKKYREKKKRKTENISTVDGVIDLRTAKTLEKLQNNKIIGPITGTIASGKESNIFLAEKGENDEIIDQKIAQKYVVVKIYRTSTLNFKKILPYIKGDKRFSKRKRGSYYLIGLWAQKEFRNLSRALKAGLSVPIPIIAKNNVLVMEFLGINNIPYPKAKDIGKNHPDELNSKIYSQLKILIQQANLVHGDLSEFNILINPENYEPYFIDMGQSVLLDHPMALYWLKRDIKNIDDFFPVNTTTFKNSENFLKEMIKNTILNENEEI